MTVHQLRMISLRCQTAQIAAMAEHEPALPAPDYSRLALANRAFCREENIEAIRRHREREVRDAEIRQIAFGGNVILLRSRGVQ